MTIKTKFPQSRMERRLVRSMREALGVSVAELAHRSYVPMSKLHAWEEGKRRLSVPELFSMVNTLYRLRGERDQKAMFEAASVESGGKYAKEYRTMFGITQLEVAREMKMKQSDISLYEKGYLKFTEKEQKRLNAVLGKLKKQHALTANEMKLFRDIEASLRRELAGEEAELAGGNQEAVAVEGSTKLSSLVGGKVTEEWAKGVRRKDGDD